MKPINEIVISSFIGCAIGSMLLLAFLYATSVHSWSRVAAVLMGGMMAFLGQVAYELWRMRNKR